MRIGVMQHKNIPQRRDSNREELDNDIRRLDKEENLYKSHLHITLFARTKIRAILPSSYHRFNKGIVLPLDYIASPKCVVNISSPNRHPPIPHTHIISILLPTGMSAPTLCILDGGRKQGKGSGAFSAYYIDFVSKFAKPSQKTSIHSQYFHIRICLC